MTALSIRNLAKTYSNGVKAVDNVNLEVREGDFFALLGPNGAGKTTIIGIISSLVNKTAGEVKILGYDIEKDHNLAKRVMGLVPQELNFNQFEKVLDIVLNSAGFYGIPRGVAFSRAEYYLQQLGLWSKRDQVSRSLSGGMKRRLMIARALVHEPKMLILDEPTAGVDIELRRSTWDFLRTINQQGTTIILTTHYLEEAESLCDGIAIIDGGKILEQTNIKSLLTQLQVETLVLDLENSLAERTNIDLPDIESRVVDNYTLEVALPKSISVNQLFTALSGQDIRVTSMRNKANRLEELFLGRIGGKHASS